MGRLTKLTLEVVGWGPRVGGKAINKEHGTAMGGSNLRSGFGREGGR